MRGAKGFCQTISALTVGLADERVQVKSGLCLGWIVNSALLFFKKTLKGFSTPSLGSWRFRGCLVPDSHAAAR